MRRIIRNFAAPRLLASHLSSLDVHESVVPPEGRTRRGHRVSQQLELGQLRIQRLAEYQSSREGSPAVTLPEKTNRPAARKRRSAQPPKSRQATRNPQAAREVEEHEVPSDQPLYRVVLDRRLQRDALLWVSLTLIASLAAVCVVAIATGSVPTALVSATSVLAAALLLIVRYAYPRRSGFER